MDEPLVVEAVATPEIDDAGRALILELVGKDEEFLDGWFIRLQSWSEHRLHPELLPLIGRKLRITIEPVEDHREMYARETVPEMLHRESVEVELRTLREEHEAETQGR